MNRRSLAAAIGNQPEPPCTTCPSFRKCGENSLACADFWNYVNDPIMRTPRDVGKPRRPSKLWYAFTFEEPDMGLPNHVRKTSLAVLGRVIADTGTLREIAERHGVSIATAHRVRKCALQAMCAPGHKL